MLSSLNIPLENNKGILKWHEVEKKLKRIEQFKYHYFQIFHLSSFSSILKRPFLWWFQSHAIVSFTVNGTNSFVAISIQIDFVKHTQDAICLIQEWYKKILNEQSTKYSKFLKYLNNIKKNLYISTSTNRRWVL